MGSNAHLRRDDGRVWIDGVPSLGWGRGRECTFAGAMEAALAVTGRPISDADIMGLAGLAFRTRWYQGQNPTWCPSSPVGEFAEELAAAIEAAG